MAHDNLLEERFGEQLLFDEPLARYTAARLGGPADSLLVVHHLADLVFAVRFAWTHDIPCRVLGGGANVLVSDTGFRGLILINKANAVTLEDTGLVTAESGANLSTLARRCIKRGLAGLEWAISVPGTVGGAVINNAGAHGGDMADSVKSVTVHHQDGMTLFSNADMHYDYRESVLKRSAKPLLITKTTLQLDPEGDAHALNELAASYVAHRKRTQPPGASLGSIFKNPPDDYAGRLIEAAGLKGETRGTVQISPVHANFFVNTRSEEESRAADYYALIKLAQNTVHSQFGMLLEPEIELLGHFEE